MTQNKTKKQREVIKELGGSFEGFAHRRHHKGKRKKINKRKIKIAEIKTKEFKKDLKKICLNTDKKLK